jgi:uncharacterized membrane protein YoaK (UPF0700 family)
MIHPEESARGNDPVVSTMLVPQVESVSRRRLGPRCVRRISLRLETTRAPLRLEDVFLFGASLCAIGYRRDLLEHSFQPFALIALTALAMGTRNAADRKLAIPDLTTTVLTLTITGIGADSSFANGNNPRLGRRVEAVVAMFLGAAFGAVIIRYSVSAALWLGTAISASCSAALFRSTRL